MSQAGFAVLIVVVFLRSFSPVSALPPQSADEKARQISEWKDQVSKRGVGQKSRWEVVLADGRRIDGYTLAIGDDSFTLVDRNTQENVEIGYSEISSLKPKVHTSRGVKIAVIAGVAVGAAFAIGAIALANSKGD